MFNKKLPLLGVMLGSLSLPGCDLDIPDLNNPGQDQLDTNPTTTSINSAATGMLIANRGAKATTTGYVNLLGILGREAYDFDASDSRFTTEMLQGPLINNDAFGGGFWAGPYASIRLGHLILHGVDKVDAYSDRDKQAIRGFVHTIQALELMVVIFTHDVTGAVIDTDRPVDDLAPFVSKDAVYVKIGELLDQGQTELTAAAAADDAADGPVPFSFPMSPGFSGFTTPKNFLKFNRAIRARIAVHHKDYQVALDALPASFLADTPPINFNTGVFYSYSVAVGDATNGLNNRGIYAHPGLTTDAKMQPDGKTPDARYVAKITSADKGNGPTGSGVSSTIKFRLYSTTASVPLIRNEELILLKAEALYFSDANRSKKQAAIDELNLVRTNSGKLAPLNAAEITNDNDFINALLYERRYSLMFEGGHRWIDFRRFGIPLPLDFAMDDDANMISKHVRNLHYPVPLAECDARKTEPACSISSQQDAP